MSGIQSYKDLLIWKKGIDIVVLVYQLISDFPKDEIYHEIIPEIGNIVFLLRYQDKLDKYFTDVSKHNIKKYNNYNFNDVYISVFEWIMTDNFMYNLYQINYFRKFIELIIKNILYNYLDDSIKLIDFNVKNQKLLKIINKCINEIMK